MKNVKGKGKRSRTVSSLVLLAVALATVMLLLEGAGRLAIRAKKRDLMVSPALNWADVQHYDPDLVWCLKPNLKDVLQRIRAEDGWLDSSINTNELGLRHPPILPKGERLRVLAIGDSTTYGAGLNNDETWPAQLQKALDPNDLGLVEVINAGVSGYTAFQGLRYLELYGLDLEPDIVITCFGHNEWCDVLPTGLRDVEWVNPEHTSGLVALVRDAIRGAEHMIRTYPLGKPHERMTAGEFIDTLAKMEELCLTNSAGLVHLVWPYVTEMKIDPRGDESGPRSLIIGAAMYADTPAINLFDLALEHGDDIFFDEIHMNAEGCRIVAEYIADELDGILQDKLRFQNAMRMVYWGTAQLEQGNTQGAIDAYRSSIASDPAHKAAYEKLDAVLEEQKDTDGRIAFWRSMVEAYPQAARPHMCLGAALETKGETNQAIAEYRTAIERDPNDTGVMKKLGLALDVIADDKGVAEILATLSQMDPAGAYVALQNDIAAGHAGRLADLARSLREKGDLDSAVRAYRDAIERDPHQVVFYQELNAVLEQGADPDNLVRVWREIADSVSFSGRPPFYLALALEKKGETEAAIAAYKSALDRDPNDTETLTNLTLLLDTTGDEQGVAEVLEIARDVDPDGTYVGLRDAIARRSAQRQADLGDTLAKQGDTDGAIRAYKQSLAHDPNQFDVCEKLRAIVEVRYDVEGRIAFWRDMADTQPETPRPYVLLADALEAKGDIQGAIAAYRGSLELYPDDMATMTHLGLALNKAGDVQGAADVLNTAKKLDPDGAYLDLEEKLRGQNAEREVNAGVVLWEQGDAEGAIEACRKAVALDPGHFLAYEKLDAMLEQRGDQDARLSFWQQTAREYPDSKWPQSHLGAAYETKGDLDQAIGSYRAALECDPDDPALHVALGRALARKGNVQGAIDALRAALELNPEITHFRADLIALLCAAGDYDGAREQVEQCRKLGVELPDRLLKKIP